ncbi:Platelet-activating factor acetylhydrolase IB subunit beta [Orchesella cincta]|uniref:Platelet-activating factor acetylhydrolase IB subunit beta n=1 Tax=Orchesella cincta TaxID=48709 RepID=A0A1D2MHY8_ORCCI|nr:Platelet-activating factor acetylhydrolase IB subunit beta [Orchesella cincta]
MSGGAANPAATPTQCQNYGDDDRLERWLGLHRRFVSEAQEKEPDVVFIGDSMIAYLMYQEMWDRLFVPMHALNFGIMAERTENVLWRVVNGEMDQMNLKAVVLLVGTNNHGNTSEQVADGIIAIVDAIKERQKNAHVIVLKLLPRGEKPNHIRERNAQVNELLAKKLVSKSQTQLLNIDPGFVQPDGTISHHDMWDYLHLTKSGYIRGFEPVHELLLQILDEEDEKIKRNANLEELAIAEEGN